VNEPQNLFIIPNLSTKYLLINMQHSDN